MLSTARWILLLTLDLECWTFVKEARLSSRVTPPRLLIWKRKINSQMIISQSSVPTPVPVLIQASAANNQTITQERVMQKEALISCNRDRHHKLVVTLNRSRVPATPWINKTTALSTSILAHHRLRHKTLLRARISEVVRNLFSWILSSEIKLITRKQKRDKLLPKLIRFLLRMRRWEVKELLRRISWTTWRHKLLNMVYQIALRDSAS